MRVAALFIHPVKGCRAVAVEDALVDALGVAGDRRFAFVQADGRALTQREQPLLATVSALPGAGVLRLDLGGLAELAIAYEEFREPAVVDVWGKSVSALAVSRPQADDYLGMPVRLAMLERRAQRSFVDSRPVLVTTTAMLAGLGLPGIGMDRFRPNVVLEGDTDARELRGEEVRLEYAKPCGRCEVTTVDQASGARRGPEPLRTLSERFGGNFGLYYFVSRPGRLRRGELLRAA